MKFNKDKRKKEKSLCFDCVSYVCLAGCLSALVYQHAITPLALPCKLLIPATGLCINATFLHFKVSICFYCALLLRILLSYNVNISTDKRSIYTEKKYYTRIALTNCD